jgi:hypothetical protein
LSVLTPVDRDRRRTQRRRASRRRLLVRRLVALATLAFIVAAVAYAALALTGGGDSEPVAAARAAPKQHKPASPRPRAVPHEIRGVHVTMALAGIPGKLNAYARLRSAGLNTIEVDVKDENGDVAFVRGAPRLARVTGAAKPYYDPRAAARKLHKAGLYLIGRIVTFQDPAVSEKRPALALHNPDGSLWHTNGGLGWLNPYDHRVWAYDVAIAKAAVRAGFDEIQFDYVRFPSDGDLSQIVYRHARAERKGTTIAKFLQYASSTLHPLGVRVSADVFGLAATHDLGIGQVPKRIAGYLDAVYPMVYPSHFSAGEYGITDPDAYPGRTVARALFDFRRQVKGRAVLIPWLQDFSLARRYGLIEVTDQIAAARRQHARGYMLWNPEGVYTRDALAG